MPRQMPSSGFFSASARMTGTRPVATSLSMASPKAPTPGRMSRSALRIVSGSAVTTVSCPSCARLDFRLYRML